MNKPLMLISTLALALFTCLTVSAQNFSELVAPGKKVYVEVVDVKDSLEDFADEVKDVNELTREEMDWVVVDSKDKADFVLQLAMSKKRIMGFPRCTMAPVILTKDGTVMWEGKEVKCDASQYNGFRATHGAYWLMVKKDFKKEDALYPAVKDK